jgi:hypothetical protein
MERSSHLETSFTSSESHPEEIDSSATALLETFPTPVKFSSLAACVNTVTAQKDRILEGTSDDEYLVFSGVSVVDFDKVERWRGNRATRLFYLGEVEVLIVKIPSRIHEGVHRAFADECAILARSMGLLRQEFFSVGSATYTRLLRGNQRTSKEADGCWINLLLRNGATDWPSLVIEAGYSQGMASLRSAARWWISRGQGQVRIVLILSIKVATRTIKVEKWVPRSATMNSYVQNHLRPRPLSNLNFPTMSGSITINQSTIPSAITGDLPLTLEFQQIIGRPAGAGANEADMVFSAQDLDNITLPLWSLV